MREELVLLSRLMISHISERYDTSLMNVFLASLEGMRTTDSLRCGILVLDLVLHLTNAAKEEMMPYFTGIMNSFKEYLTEIQSSETMCLQVQSVDTLGILARTIGNENFMPMTRETMELGIQLINKTDDPDLRKSLYGLFASVSTVLKQEMAPYLTIIVDLILKSIRIDKGICSRIKESTRRTN
ncbi:Importin 4 [Homalodisca vitripennis]|nr:Importin 4 [Homalodisca vitripennis]